MQNLTSDRTRLLRTLERVGSQHGYFGRSEGNRSVRVPLTGRTWNTINDGRCLCGICVLDTIARVADGVQSATSRRKVLFFIGSDLILQTAGSADSARQDVGCEKRLRDARDNMFRRWIAPT